MSRHRLVDAPRSDALLIAVLVGGLAALGAGAYWAIKTTIEAQQSDEPAQAPRPKPVDRPAAMPVEQPAVAVPTPEPETEPPRPEPDLGPEVDGACELDEVACLLADVPPECCRIYSDRSRAEDPLSREDITDVVSAAKDKITACNERDAFDGTVRASVTVLPNGRVQKVSLDGDPPPRLERCMTSTIKKLKFRRTRHGGSFRYPFRFAG